MSDYISREAVAAYIRSYASSTDVAFHMEKHLNEIPAADVLPRDEAIKMGAELAAMHGSDATSQQLEEAYLEGVEDGMTRRDVRPVVRGKWEEVEVIYPDDFEKHYPSIASMFCPNCQKYASTVFHYGNPTDMMNFCPNCGAKMVGGQEE